MLSAAQRVLVLAPHTDDGEFGCGGTMARLLDAGVDVRYVAFSIATKSLPPGFPPDTLAREVREATAEIGPAPEPLTVPALEQRHVEGKVAAPGRYESQQHCISATAADTWTPAKARGINIGRELAEVFE